MSSTSKEPKPWTTTERWIGELKASVCYELNVICFLLTGAFSARDQLPARSACAFLPIHIEGVDAFDGSKSTPADASLSWKDCITSVVWNLMLLLLFVAQHSIMGRLKIQEKWSKLFGKGGERTMHLIASIGVVQILTYYWRPMTQSAWHFASIFSLNQNTFDSSSIRSTISFSIGSTLDAMHMVAWIWLLSSLLTTIWHDLFSYRQSFVPNLSLPVVAKMQPDIPIVYRFSRHPIFSALLAVMWLTSRMSVGRLLWSALFSIYTFFGCMIQEHELLLKDAKEGRSDWRRYLQRVPRLLPWPLGRPMDEMECRSLEKGLGQWFKPTSIGRWIGLTDRGQHGKGEGKWS